MMRAVDIQVIVVLELSKGPSNDEAPTAAREDDQQQTAATTDMQLHDRAFSDIMHGDIDTNESRTHFVMHVKCSW